MKIFVAGISFDYNIFLYNLKEPISTVSLSFKKANEVITLLKQITEEAVQSLGEDAIVVVVLHEYALTTKMIHDKTRIKILNLLQEAVDKYPNILLIPGSFSTYQSSSDYNEKHKENEIKQDSFQKQYRISEKYHKSYNVISKKDSQFNQHHKEIFSLFSQSSLSEFYIIKNVSYLMTSKKSRIKYKKSHPCDERKPAGIKLEELFDKKKVYDIGDDNPMNEITFNNAIIDVGMAICYDSYFINRKYLNERPLLHIIISDSVEIETPDLLGALNIHMDSDTGLCVYLDEAHKQRSKIEKLDIKSYFIKNKDNIVVIDSKIIEANSIYNLDDLKLNYTQIN